VLYIIEDSVRFPEQLATIRTITRRYNMYPRRIATATVAIQGIDYGFSEQEGYFFRSQIQTASKLVSANVEQVDITFYGFTC
jgi:hypothetical protein